MADEKMSAAERILAAEARRRALAETMTNAAEEQYADDVEALATIEEQHGAQAKYRVTTVTVAGRMVVLIRQAEVIYQKFKVATEKSGKNPIPDAEVERFVSALVEYPAKEDFKKLLSDNPASIGDLAMAGASLYGLKTAEDQGK